VFLDALCYFWIGRVNKVRRNSSRFLDHFLGGNMRVSKLFLPVGCFGLSLGLSLSGLLPQAAHGGGKWTKSLAPMFTNVRSSNGTSGSSSRRTVVARPASANKGGSFSDKFSAAAQKIKGNATTSDFLRRPTATKPKGRSLPLYGGADPFFRAPKDPVNKYYPIRRSSPPPTIQVLPAGSSPSGGKVSATPPVPTPTLVRPPMNTPSSGGHSAFAPVSGSTSAFQVGAGRNRLSPCQSAPMSQLGGACQAGEVRSRGMDKGAYVAMCTEVYRCRGL